MSLPDLAGAADIGAARRIVSVLLEKSGVDSPALDARILVGHALSLDHAALAASAKRALAPQERETVAQLVARRLKGEPVARILGMREFWGLPFKLSHAALVPRPETETVVEAALATIDANHSRRDPLLIADLGVGSGAILLALLHELPNAFGIGTDREVEAIATSRGNAAALGLAGRAAFAITDFGAGLDRAFDLIVSNPPYIATGDIATLPREVREHDPLLALDGGADGLAAYRTIARQAPDILRPGASVIVEIGRAQASDVEAIFTRNGAFEMLPARCDLAGVPRALTFCSN